MADYTKTRTEDPEVGAWYSTTHFGMPPDRVICFCADYAGNFWFDQVIDGDWQGRGFTLEYFVWKVEHDPLRSLSDMILDCDDD
jgi:hypothetical protein